MKITIEKLPKSTIKLNVIVENEKIKEAYEEILNNAVKTTEVQGFRIGNAPKEMVAEKIGVSSLYGDVVNNVLQKYYIQALKEKGVSPVSNPRVEIKEFDMEKDFEFTATVATRPEVKLGDYAKELKKKYEEKQKEAKKQQAEKLKNLKEDEKLDEIHVHLTANEVIDTLIDTSDVEIADLLIEEESERMMNQLLKQIQSIGLTLDKYLNAQEKKEEDLKSDYEKFSKRNLTAEFVFAHLIDKENIVIEEKEIEDMITASGDPNAIAMLNDPMQKAYVKSILQKNKIISKIIEEIEGKDHEHK